MTPYDKALQDLLAAAKKLIALEASTPNAAQQPKRAPLPQDGQVRYPFGKHRGALLSEVPVESLQWAKKAVSESINDPSKSKWRQSNEDLLAALEAELAVRNGDIAF